MSTFLAIQVIIAFIGSLACVVVYWPRFDRHNPVGANAMAWMLVALGAFTLGLIRIWASETWWFSLARAVVFTACNIVIWWRLMLLIRARREDLETEDEDQPA